MLIAKHRERTGAAGRAARLALPAAALFVLLGLLVHGHHATAPDRIAFDVLDPIESKAARRVVRVFTDVGSFPIVVLVAALGAVFAVRAERPGQAIALLLGTIALVFLYSLMKDIWDRPRPADRFYQPGGSSFPSGHSAQAIVWIAAAAAVGRRPLIIAACVLAVAIGLSRLYLHVHYLTDVLGGFALGTAVLAPSILARSR